MTDDTATMNRASAEAAFDLIQQVDPLRFPLQGSHLIEASAGTGKTWTIAALYLRLVLGHGGQSARLPSEILVLTFTDAAAQELRDRIRQRLDQAAWAFGESARFGETPEDALLADLLESLPHDQHAACAQTLELAAQSMDDAAISTIHGWCRKVLEEHAFESGSLFKWQVQTQLQDIRRLCVWDYWRACVAPLAPDILAEVQQLWSGPESLLDACWPMLTQADLPALDARSLTQVWQDFQDTLQARLLPLKQPWQAGGADFQHWLEALGKDCKIRAHHRRRWAQILIDWAHNPQEVMPNLGKGWTQLAPDGLRENWQGPAPAPHHPLSEALPALQAELRALPGLRGALYAHAWAWVGHRLRQHLDQAGMLGFDGLLAKVDAALTRGEALRDSLRRKYPIVLIDEFQDTDPLQYRIFDRIYQVADNDPSTLLVLIGDPKQSIYGFRGADVHTYLRAADACGVRVQTLARNYRSSKKMVQAVNHCFEQAGAQAFPSGGSGRPLAFHPVSAQGLPAQWEINGEPAPALSAWWVPAPESGQALKAADFDQAAADYCARQIAALLAQGRAGRAGVCGADHTMQPIRAGNIAVLVSTSNQARYVRAALGRAGLRSVYLSERDCVYATAVAQELLGWLRACLEPEHEESLRAALASPTLGMEDAALIRLIEDELAWDAMVERFQGYRQCWLRRGVLPMLRQLFHDFDVPARLLADGREGERRLTDCLHLAELLQEAAVRLDGPQALLRHLHEQLADTDWMETDDARCLRLESDDHLIRIVTIHKSKGLEYPFVFLPYGCRAPSGGNRSFRPYQLPSPEGLRWVLDPQDSDQTAYASERLGEEVRKLYVALTRARHAVWLVLGPVGTLSRASGMGHLLGDDLQAGWQALVDAAPGIIAWAEDPEPAPPPAASQSPGAGSGRARDMIRPVVTQPWWIASYSALTLQGPQIVAEPHLLEPAQSAEEDTLVEGWRMEQGAPWQEASEAASQAVGMPRPVQTPWSAFPRGSQAGTFLHGLLEWAGQRRFLPPEGLRDMIARRCAVRGWEAHIDALHAWLTTFCETAWHLPLPERPALILNRLQACLPEMEFWMPVQSVDVAALDRLVTGSVYPGHPRPALGSTQLNGMFKGFVDLVVQHQGRYYLIDYKSNHLGDQDYDYRADRLQAAMLHARYDVQSMVYLLALHRQLRQRLAHYDYERDMGGAVYMFLRGQSCPGQGLVAFKPPGAVMDALDALFAGRTEPTP